MSEDNGRATRPTSFWLDDETRTMLDELSERTDGMSRSAIVREAVRLMHSNKSTAEIRRLVKALVKATGT